MPVTAVSVSVAPGTASINAEGSKQFVSTVHWSDGASTPELCGWVSSDDAVATVNSGWQTAGLALAKSEGTATITASYPPPFGGAIVSHVTEIAGSATLVVTPSVPMIEPECRFQVAFDSPALTPDPIWTSLDEIPNLVTSYSIDRGRSFELDRPDTGRATVQIIDPNGLLDPRNPDGPWYGKLQPLLPAQIGRRNPVSGEWASRYRGFIEDFAYEVDPARVANRLTLTLVDLFDILTAAEMNPGQFGNTPPEESLGQVYYPAQSVHDRIVRILNDFGLPNRLRVIMPGAVNLWPVVYSPGETVLAAIQEAADGEMPGANIACDRAGRIVFQDRKSRFDPAGVLGELGWEKWDYREWRVADESVVDSLSDSVQVRQFSYSRSLSRIINAAHATPARIEDWQVQGQLATVPDSIALFGVRSWSADGLLTMQSTQDGADALWETRRFSIHIVVNYNLPLDRITSITFRSLPPGDPRASALWQFLLSVDLGHSLDVHVSTTGSSGFEAEGYFVEGIHEEARPLQPGYDDVTMRLDLSPRAYYDDDPWSYYVPGALETLPRTFPMRER